ncbi:MAG TPA: Lrp/AsnC ligand binding domain-containing protein [Nitrosarchaeum sp.]|nr:Lrp/AsnC ligand binding domain-containing protein [Nitrosarchaeum sp.]
MYEQCKIVYPHQRATAHVIIKCRSDSASVVEQLRSISGVQVQKTVGAYDILAKVEADDYQSLRKLIRWKISNHDQISSSLTLMCMGKNLCVGKDQNEEPNMYK